MLRIDSAQWFGLGLVEPVLGARHHSAEVILRDFGQFSDALITASAQPLVGWPEPFVVELEQLDDRAAYLATERDILALGEEGLLGFAVLDSLYSWANGCTSYRLVLLHTSEAVADVVAGMMYHIDDELGHRAYPVSHYIARQAIEAGGQWVNVQSRPSYDDLDNPYQVWYQRGGFGPHAGQYLVTSRPTLAEAQDALRQIAERGGADLDASGLKAHRPPVAWVRGSGDHGDGWFIVAPAQAGNDAIGQDMLWDTTAYPK